MGQVKLFNSGTVDRKCRPLYRACKIMKHFFFHRLTEILSRPRLFTIVSHLFFTLPLLSFTFITLPQTAQSVEQAVGEEMPPSPWDLRCEYLRDPLGIDSGKPRFSWKLTPIAEEIGTAQTAYRVVVASSPEALRDGRGDRWDSGKVSSAQQHLVTYEGQPLTAGDEGYWQVRYWDENGQASAWSEVARFTVGPLELTDWVGNWIGHDFPADYEITEAVWYRRELTLAEKPEQALVYLTTPGWHEFHVNGRKVDERVLSPSVSASGRLLYVTYDISEQLKQGKNVFGVWLSPGGIVGGSNKPIPFLVHSHFDGQPALVSDRDWVSKLSNRRLHVAKRFKGEIVEASERNDAWSAAGIDTRQWQPVRVEAQPVRVEEISAAMLEPDRVVETLKPLSITGKERGDQKVWLIDFGKNFTGFLDLTLEGAPGEEVLIDSSDGRPGVCQFGQRSILNLDAEGRGHFRHHFNYCCGRHVTLTGEITEPKPEALRALVVTNDRKRTGRFHSSNELLNAIYATDLRTYIANTNNGYTMDCPHRERKGYGEVAGATTWGCALPNYESGAIIRKWIQDWRDRQSSSGSMPTTAPFGGGGGGTLWHSAPVVMSWDYYLTYGDKQLLRNTYATLVAWLEFLQGQVKDGILRQYGHEVWGFLGDWARPHRGSHPRAGITVEEAGERYEISSSPAALHFNNCVYAFNLMIAIRSAQELGLMEDARRYAETLEELRRNIHEEFFLPETGVYLDTDQLRQAFSLLTGVTPPGEREKVLENFLHEITEHRPYFDAGSSGLPMLLRFLTLDLERPDIVLEVLLREEEPGYANLIKHGCTTWPEYWGATSGQGSQIHTCYTGIAGWFIKGLAGIRPDPEHPGFQRFLLRPYFAPQLEWVEADHESVYGKIVSSWSRQNGMLQYRMSVPPNTTAEVSLPVAPDEILRSFNTQTGENLEIPWRLNGQGLAQASVPAGSYTLQIRR